MPLPKQPVSISFAQGIDTKTDPFQIPIGNFEFLKNKVFNKSNRLDKRNGYRELASITSDTATFTTTFKGGLSSVGQNVFAYSTSNNTWTNKGFIDNINLRVQPLIRESTSQTSCDSATHSNGLTCVVFTDAITGGTQYKYTVLDSETSQVLKQGTLSSVTGSPRVFVLQNYFVIVYPATANLNYIAISAYSPTTVTTPVTLTTAYAPGTAQGAYDGVVANSRLYIAFNGTDGGGAVRITYLTSTLSQGSTAVFATEVCTMMSVCANTQHTQIFCFYYTTAGTIGKVLSVDQNLNTVFTPQSVIAAGTIVNVTCAADNTICYLFYETQNAYSYDAAVPTNFITRNSTNFSGTVGSPTVIMRGVGIASKAFLCNDDFFLLSAYKSNYQPTYFLLGSAGAFYGKVAYQNGNGYSTTGLPSVTVSDLTAKVSYLTRTVLIPVNKTQAASTSAGVYAQTGINEVAFQFGETITSSEIGENLHLSGGVLWAYDGTYVTEQGFELYPDNVECTWSAVGGSMAAQPDGATNINAYYYVALYEYTDNQGNIFRSAPSVPVGVTTTGALSTGSVTVNVPTLRMSYRGPLVKIVIYRWSVAQQTYYQVTSVSAPTLNSTSVNSIAFVDTLADASIIGNSIVYTTGGVLENIAPPATTAMSLYRSRLFLIDAEDPNLLWFSKQIIEGTPVEMSDLLTLFVAPTTGAQGSTGQLRCLSPMDDKLILFKSDALYYIVGNGPDNTGANNDFSEPIFITSTIGSSNQNSIVFQPMGLMFESDKGIWILKRDLSTEYIGSPVEAYTQNASVLSAVNVPETNQVRFVMDSGVTLMYDYFFGQWSIFEGVSAVSSTIFEGFHTYIDPYGRVFQESPGQYLDGSRPVLISLRTGWINVAGIQGYERAYFFYLLGEFKSPHKLNIDIAYDYNPSPTQSAMITPDNFNPDYGDDDGNDGDVSPYGGNSSVEKWRIFFKQQKCEAFQITITEIYDPAHSVAPGEGLTLSGINMVIGTKKGYRPQSANTSAG